MRSARDERENAIGNVRLTRRALVGALVALGPGASRVRASEPVRVAAASDLHLAMAEIAAAFTRAGGAKFHGTFGSSGNFARMIQQGAPFELFLSADADYVDRLVAAGLTDGPGTVYATGRLALIRPQHTDRPDGAMGLDDLRRMLAEGQIRRFAIANPEHAPYGARAREALKSAGLWPALEGKLVLGENVSQATQYVLSGAAQAGMTAASIVHGDGIGSALDKTLVSAELHSPLRQTMVLIKGATPTARALHDFIAGAEGQAILRRFGFEAP